MKHDFIDENAREQLSALLDGELDGDAARFLQRRLQHDDALVGQLVRWQLAGDVLRTHARSGDDDLASRVRAAIDREHTQAKPRRGWMLWGGGLAAVAALGFAALNLPGTNKPLAAPAANEIAATQAPSTTIKQAVSAPVAAALPAETKSQPVLAARVPVARRVADIASRHHQRETLADVPPRVRHEANPASAVKDVHETATVVAAADPAKSLKDRSRNPFAMPTKATELAWPKAVLPGFNSGLNADFRSDGNNNPFMPHRTFGEPLQDR